MHPRTIASNPADHLDSPKLHSAFLQLKLLRGQTVHALRLGMPAHLIGPATIQPSEADLCCAAERRNLSRIRNHLMARAVFGDNTDPDGGAAT